MRQGVPRDMTIQVIKIESDLFLEGTARLCESLARVVEVKLPSTLAVNRASPATGFSVWRAALFERLSISIHAQYTMRPSVIKLGTLEEEDLSWGLLYDADDERALGQARSR